MSTRPDDQQSSSSAPAEDADATRYGQTPTADPEATRYTDPDATRYSDDTAAPIPPPTPPVLPRVPGYEILGELGRSGMGVVYKARQLGFNRIVAIKMILSGSHAGAEELARFRIEGEAVARLQHPNIVQVFEVGEYQDRPFFSMEFCPGGGLNNKLNGTPMPPAEAARLVETLARAVQAAHDEGVIHRDLKPANVLLTADGTPKVADFGLAKRMDAEGRTLPGVIMGTPSYMAPEQAAPEEADGKPKVIGPAADIYALGAILYECLTGRPPFRAATLYETIMQVVSDDPVPPRQLQSKTPRDLETICLKCLEKQPARRYAAAAELADDVARWRRGEPVRARPPSLGYVLGKWAWRRRALLVVAAGVLLLIAAVVAGAFVQIMGARDEAVRKGNDLEKKEGELRGALNQKQQTLDSLNTQLSLLAWSYADKSDIEYRAAHVRDCVSWMLRAYEAAPAGDPLRRSYQRLISARGLSLPGLALWHEGPVFSASFSPDGRAVVTAGEDHTARLWDAASGKEIKRLPHERGVFTASFSPDGRTVLTVGADGARVWDAASGEERTRLDNAATAASFSPDGRTVLTVAKDRTARLWAAGGNEMHLIPHGKGVQEASFSPDGRTVLTVGFDQTVRLWNAASGEELQRLPHNAQVNAASFSPDGLTVFTASEDGMDRLWDAAGGKEKDHIQLEGVVFSASFSPDGRTVLALTSGQVTQCAAYLWRPKDEKAPSSLLQSGWVSAASFSPDGRAVLTVSKGEPARLWDAADGRELHWLPDDAHASAASFSPDARMVAAVGEDGAVRLWDLAGGKELERLRQGGDVYAASFSPDGRALLTAGWDKTARLWDAQTGQELHRLPHKDEVRVTTFSPDGRTLLTAGRDNTARLWDAQTGQELQRLRHDWFVHSASFSPDGRTVVTASWDKTARLWDAADGKELQRLTHEDILYAASFSPDGRTVVTASWDKTARLWDARTGEELQRFAHGDAVVWSASFSPDGRYVLTLSASPSSIFPTAVRLWDATGRKEPQLLLHDEEVDAASFSPDGRMFVTAGETGNIRLWDASGKELKRIDTGGEVAQFSPDGRTVLTAGHEGSARLWDVASGKEMQRLRHGSVVFAASFSPDGRMVVTGGGDRAARLWDVRFLSPPDEMDRDRLRAWVLVRTGQDFTEEGSLHPLNRVEWQQQRQILDAKGGDWQMPIDPRKWHFTQAVEVEAGGYWFAARFHLNWLLQDDPNNPDLLRRRDEAEAHLQAP